MSPEGAFLTLVLAVLVDTWGIGGPRLAPLFDRLAFVGWVAVFAVGFKASGLTETVNSTVTGLFAMLAGLWDAPLFQGGVRIGPQIIGWIVAAVTLGAMVPQRVKVLGKLSHIQFEHLRQAGATGLAATGVGRAAGATGVSRGGSWIKKLFPGTVNIGMVALALLLVSSAAVVNGGVGRGIDWGVDRSVAVAAWITHPLLASTGAA